MNPAAGSFVIDPRLQVGVERAVWQWSASLPSVCLSRCRWGPSPPAGASPLPLQRLFATFAVETPSQDSLMVIFGTFLHGHLKKFSTGRGGSFRCRLRGAWPCWDGKGGVCPQATRA